MQINSFQATIVVHFRLSLDTTAVICEVIVVQYERIFSFAKRVLIINHNRVLWFGITSERIETSVVGQIIRIQRAMNYTGI